MAVDEIFLQHRPLQRHATGGVVLGCSLKDGKATLRFSDNGRPYDPTEKPDPDTTQSAEEREVGGLGIFMVKKPHEDEVTYEYADGSNILTLVKSLLTDRTGRLPIPQRSISGRVLTEETMSKHDALWGTIT